MKELETLEKTQIFRNIYVSVNVLRWFQFELND